MAPVMHLKIDFVRLLFFLFLHHLMILIDLDLFESQAAIVYFAASRLVFHPCP